MLLSVFALWSIFRLACDMSVVSLLRSRGVGNSASQLRAKLDEQHCRKYQCQVTHYLYDCRGFARSKSDQVVAFEGTDSPPPRLPVPTRGWIQHVYCLDVMGRVEEVKASITDIFGRILKMDSTKKVSRHKSSIQACVSTQACMEPAMPV